jgi:redox-sensitive bicupin YhaK (pirin superfamily)
MGLRTVTWLLAGEVLHTDSIGSEQLIRPGS